jgi:hypothetical protein
MGDLKMTVKEFAEYLLNNFDHDKTIAIRACDGDPRDLDEVGGFYDIDDSFCPAATDHNDRVVIL